MVKLPYRMNGASSEGGGALGRTAREVVPTFPDLAGKIVVVTGGSKGIGAATCRAFGRNGSKVVVVARSENPIGELVDDLRAEDIEAIGLAADCTKSEEMARVRERVESQWGPVDVLVTSAGGFGQPRGILDLEEGEWLSLLESNLTGTFVSVQTFLRGMVERHSGSIVTVSSSIGRYVDRTVNAAYAVAKAGVIVLSQHIAKEVGQYGVRVNCVAPATVLTERVQGILSEAQIEEIAGMAPLGRLGVPDDVAYAALYLSSASAGWITGVTIDVAGGRIML